MSLSFEERCHTFYDKYCLNKYIIKRCKTINSIVLTDFIVSFYNCKTQWYKYNNCIFFHNIVSKRMLDYIFLINLDNNIVLRGLFIPVDGIYDFEIFPLFFSELICSLFTF